MKIFNFKENKAITLIALVITIIVLLILAAVSINLILGQNGILTKAREGRENYELASEEEQRGLNSLFDDIDNQIDEDLDSKSWIIAWIQKENGWTGPYIKEDITTNELEEEGNIVAKLYKTGYTVPGVDIMQVPCKWDAMRLEITGAGEMMSIGADIPTEGGYTSSNTWLGYGPMRRQCS